MSAAMISEQTRTNSPIVALYSERTGGSAALAREAAALLPSGIAHDARNLKPYVPYVERASGAYKWDVDGNRYIDFYGGHGALLLGHCHPVVEASVVEALGRGTQFGANHPLEVRWAKAITRLVPSAERIRFTSSGTEATLMAVRLARAFTGKQTLLRFKGHFHGWHDHMTSGYINHFDGSPTPGVLAGVADKAVLLPPGDVEALASTLASNNDIAAAIIEPTGSSFGQVPLRPEFLRELRRLTAQHGVLLILDEVVTGFRVSPGGAQVAFEITPDLSSFAKIVAGGLPGAAVAGRRDILDRLDFDAARTGGWEKVQHPGTFNANPVSAAAGTAALTIVAESDACTRASELAARLRSGLNAMLDEEGVPWAAYGTFSGFHIFMNPNGRELRPRTFDPFDSSLEELKTQSADLVNKFRLALLVQGVDVGNRLSGFLSAAHSEADVDDAVIAFQQAIRMMRAERALPV